MKHHYRFEFEDIILKPLEEADIENLRMLRNKEKRFFVTQDEIDSRAQKKWYQSYLGKKDDIMFKIVKKKEPDTFIGAIALYHIDRKKKEAEFGRLVVDKEAAPEKGVGLMATRAVCMFGFRILQLEKIICEALKNNGRALSIYDRAGFAIVGEDGVCCSMEVTRRSISLGGRSGG